MNEQNNRLQHWAFPRLKLGCRCEVRYNSPHISQSETYFHHLRRHHLARRQQGQGSQDAITAWHASLCQQTSINGGLLTVSQKTMNNHGCKMVSLSHWRWIFHASINEVPSLTIKTASNKVEQFSATPLEEKTIKEEASLMNINSSTRNQWKLRKVNEEEYATTHIVIS